MPTLDRPELRERLYALTTLAVATAGHTDTRADDPVLAELLAESIGELTAAVDHVGQVLTAYTAAAATTATAEEEVLAIARALDPATRGE